MDLGKNIEEFSIMKANGKKHAHVLLYMPMPVFDEEVDRIMKDCTARDCCLIRQNLQCAL